MTVRERLAATRVAGSYRLRVDDFLILDRAGAFDRHAKTELLGGEIFYMNAQHRPHALAKMRLYDALRHALTTLRSPLLPLVEASVAMGDHDAPEPDIVVTSEPEGEGLIPAASVALIAEISDTTFATDISRKQMIYSGAAIPEYWVVDLNGRLVHQMWSPAAEGYMERRIVSFGDPVTAVKINGLTIATVGL